MRNFSLRPLLEAKHTKKLDGKTKLILASATPEKTADKIYTAARQTKWFQESVVATLGLLAGKGERCMFCGGSEASQVDHFEPKDTYPHSAMLWENFIWICGLCNQNKGNRFPKNAGGANILINPIDEDIWDYYTLDKFGYLLPNWDIVLDDYEARARQTEQIIKINRQAAQEARYARYQQLERTYLDLINLHQDGRVTPQEILDRVNDDVVFPLHPEVPQFFLKGKGKTDEPFATVLAIIRNAGL